MPEIPDILTNRGVCLDTGALGDHTERDAFVVIGEDQPRPGTVSVIWCAVVGSRAQGLETNTSDTDRRGIYLAPIESHLGLTPPPAQLVSDADQACFWEVGKFLRLALKANPTVLETLFSPLVEVASPWAARLVAERSRFLSRKAHATFLNYASAQFKKMERSRDRDGVTKWAHAMHLIRLLHVGIELFETGTLDVRVPPERRSLLLAIKAGAHDWDVISAMRDELSGRFETAADRSGLPDEPDHAYANDVLIELRLHSAGSRAGSGGI